jgi:hypothetical protein
LPRAERRPNTPRRKKYLLILIAAAAVIGLVAVILLAIGSRKGPPGETWTHKELLSYLRAKGLRIYALPTNHGSSHGPAMFFTRRLDRLAVDDPPIVEYDFVKAQLIRDTVYVQRRKSAQDAKERSGADAVKGFSWGRFYFYGDDKLINRIKRVLGD